MRRAALVFLAVAMVIGGTATAASAKRGFPSNFRRHTGRYWTWYGPRGWQDSQGANDLYVESPTGTLFLHYGTSSAICSNPPYYTTIAGYFRYIRGSYKHFTRANFDFWSFGLKSAHYTHIGRIHRLGRYYYRQSAKFAGRRPNGEQIKGEMMLDFYGVQGGCGERQEIRSAPARGNRASIRELRKVQQYIAIV